MPYKTTSSEQDGVLRIKTQGKRNKDDTRAFWIQVADECRARKIERVLLVNELTGPTSVTDTYNLAARPEDLGMSRDIQIAVVAQNADTFHNNHFASLVAENRGWRVKTFGNESDAIRWLQSDQRPT